MLLLAHRKKHFDVPAGNSVFAYTSDRLQYLCNTANIVRAQHGFALRNYLSVVHDPGFFPDPRLHGIHMCGEQNRLAVGKTSFDAVNIPGGSADAPTRIILIDLESKLQKFIFQNIRKLSLIFALAVYRRVFYKRIYNSRHFSPHSQRNSLRPYIMVISSIFLASSFVNASFFALHLQFP